MKHCTLALVALLVAVGAPAEACETPTTDIDVVTSLRTAITAYQDLDVDGFEAAADKAEAQTVCLGESLKVDTAAELHRVRGLLAFVRDDPENAKLRFAAARTIQPDFKFEAIVPEGNAAYILYKEFAPDPERLVTVPPLKDGSIRLDGSSSRLRHPELPVAAQFLDQRGQVTESLLIPGGKPLPPYEIGKERKRGPNIPFLVAAGAFGAISGASAIVSNRSGAAYYEDGRTNAELDALKGRTNLAANTSVVTGVVGAGLAVTAFVRGRW